MLRHAKSSWKDETLSDFERPLAGRGRKAAAGIAEHLRDEGRAPDRVLCAARGRLIPPLARRDTRGSGLGLSRLGLLLPDEVG